jgi:DNA repair exonuclease SbcCD ATPase subunit
MYIIIENFRKHKKLELQLCEGEIVLFKGDNGVGKSTVFNAIYWCLYGTLRKVSSKWATNSTVLRVTLQFQGCTVIRSKNPDLLKVSLGEGEYNDDVAQSQIYQIYGDESFWINCCYSRQETKNIFLKGTENERMELLNNLSFNNTDVEKIRNKINTKISQITLQLQNSSENYNLSLEKYNSYLTENTGKFTDEDKNTNIESIEIELKECKKTLEEFSNKKSWNDTNIQLYFHHNELLKKCNDSLSVDCEIYDLQKIEEEIETIKINIFEATEYIKNYPLHLKNTEDISQLKCDLASLPHYKDVHVIYNEIINFNKSLTEVIQKENNLKSQLQLYNTVKKLQSDISKIQIRDVNEISKRLDECNMLWNSYKENESKKESQNKLYNEIDMLKNRLTQGNLENLESLQLQKDTLSNYLQYETLYKNNIKTHERISYLKTELSKYGDYTKYINSEWNNETYNNHLNELNIYTASIKICEALKLNYDENIIKERISKTENRIHLEPEVLKCREALRIKTETSKLSNYNVTKDDLQNSQNKINILQAGIHALQCPSCNTVLRLQEGTLVLHSGTPSTHIQLQNAMETHKKLQIEYEFTLQRLQLEAQLEKMGVINYNIIDDINVQMLYMELNMLKNIVFVNIPKYTFEELQILQNVNVSYNELQLINNNIVNLPEVNFDNIKVEYSLICEKINTYVNITTQISQLTGMYNEIKPSEISKPLFDINTLQTEYTNACANESIRKNLVSQLNSLYNGNVNNIENDLLQYENDLKKCIEEKLYMECKLQSLQSEHTHSTITNNNKNAIMLQLQTLQGKEFNYNKDCKYKTETAIKELQNVYENKKDFLETAKKNNENVILLKKQIFEHTSVVNDLKNKIDHTLNDRIQQYKNKCTNLENTIHRYNLYNKFIELYKVMYGYGVQMQQLQNVQKGLHQIDAISRDTERYCLETTVDTINNRMFYICNRMFDGEFIVKLNLYKSLKNGNIKSAVTVDIYINGVAHSPDELSPGQLSKISIAFTVCLHEYNKFPILLLDESMSYLSCESREKCLETIRECNLGTVLIIGHMDVEGYYDNVINFENK